MRRGSPRSRCRWTRSARSSVPRARSSTPSPRKPARRSPSRTTAPCSSAPPTDLRHRPRSTGSTRSPTRSCPRPASDSSEQWSRPPTSVRSCRCCRVATGWCTSPNSAGASASRRSRTSSTSATSCAWKSPTSTSAARSRWYSSTKKPENPATVTQHLPRRPRKPIRRVLSGPVTRPHRRRRKPMPQRPAVSPGTQPLRRGRHSAEPSSAFRRTTLPGGLRVVTEYLPAVHSASVGVWVGVGSRDEGATVAGAAHFLEHLLFKSTPTRTAVDIAQAMDAVGGELNAFTAKEHTCYYAHVLDSDLELAVDLVGDVVLNGRCATDDVELERDVVLEEIAMRDDDPEDALGDMFLAALFGDHPVGRPVIGSVQSVSAMTRARLHSFHVRRYTPERMVVAVAGNVDHDDVVALVREHFGPRLIRDRRPERRSPSVDVGQPERRADACLSGGAHAWPVLEAPLGPLGAQHRARRWLEFALVPTGSGIPRVGVLGLLVVGHVLRQRCAVGVRRVPARAFRRSGAGDHRGARDGGARRHHRGGMPDRQGFAARRAGARLGGLQFPDEPHRPKRTQLR